MAILDRKAKKSKKWTIILFSIALFLPFSCVYMPGVAIYYFVIADLYTPYKTFGSKTFDQYHKYLVDKLPEREEEGIPELQGDSFTREDVMRLSRGFTYPVVIRGLLKNASAVEKWHSSDWWVENYGAEQILCGTLDTVRAECTVKDFFQEVEEGNPFYISGASKIFDRNPSLASMVEDRRLDPLESGPRKGTQIFMGMKDMGSDIHSAIGINLFRQIVGQKKWWFIPPSQTAYLKPSINVNGISAHTHTMVGKNGEAPSPWLSKVERYTAVLNPGDVLINPPWFWHGILNLGEKENALSIGVPTRYSGIVAAFQSNPMLSGLALTIIFKNYVSNGFKMPDLEDSVKSNRMARMEK